MEQENNQQIGASLSGILQESDINKETAHESH
jgi:hypothetical protein